MNVNSNTLPSLTDAGLNRYMPPRQLATPASVSAAKIVTIKNDKGLYVGEAVGEAGSLKCHGFGRLILTNGNKYIGEFEYGETHGMGKIEDKIKGIHIGQFKRGKIDGLGMTCRSDGEVRIGEFKAGELVKILSKTVESGVPASVSAATGQKRIVIIEKEDGTYVGEAVGKAESLKCHGFGRLILTNGNRYTGDFKYGKYHGFGKLEKASGNTYIGQFENGGFDGEGTFIFTNGKVLRGGFRQGQLVPASQSRKRAREPKETDF